MKPEITEQFFDIISSRNTLQEKYLKSVDLTQSEMEGLSDLLDFFIQEEGWTLEQLAEAYLFINQMVMEEQYYFVRNGKYRYSTFEEADEHVYQNHEYMTQYMTGLALSDYIWIQHIKTIRYYEKFLTEQEHKDSYLEIGPGYGQFLIRSIRSGKWNEYLAVDVSPTSVEMCKKFLKCAGISANVETRDFLAFEADRRFDCIVCGEVLEHVEQPGQMMKKCAIC